MDSNISIDVDKTSFIVNQLMSIDDLIEGKPLPGEFEVVFYNKNSDINKSPDIISSASILDYEGSHVASLDCTQKRYTDWIINSIEVITGGICGISGLAIGRQISEELGAFVGGGIGVLASNLVPKLYNIIRNEKFKSKGELSTYIISKSELGTELNCASLENYATMYFGVIKNFSQLHQMTPNPAEKKVHYDYFIDRLNKISTDVQHKLMCVFNQEKELLSSHYDDIKGISETFSFTLREHSDMIKLRSKMNLSSSMLSTPNYPSIRTAKLGHFSIKKDRACKTDIHALKDEFMSNLKNKQYYLKTSMNIEMMPIINSYKNQELCESTSQILFYINWQSEKEEIFGYVTFNKSQEEITDKVSISSNILK